MQLMVYLCYWLIVFKNDNLKYRATSPRRSCKSFLLFYIFFLSSFSFLISFFKLSYKKKHNFFSLYRISYTLSFRYVLSYVVSEIWIGGRFLEECFYCYSQQIISAIANESPIPYKNLIKRAKTQYL